MIELRWRDGDGGVHLLGYPGQHNATVWSDGRWTVFTSAGVIVERGGPGKVGEAVAAAERVVDRLYGIAPATNPAWKSAVELAEGPLRRAERDLRHLAVNFSAGNIRRGMPERLECLAAYMRHVEEAEKRVNEQPNTYEATVEVYHATIARLRAAGVAPGVGEFTFSPCCGPDAP